MARKAHYQWTVLGPDRQKRARLDGLEAIKSALRNEELLAADLCVPHQFAPAVPVSKAADSDALAMLLNPLSHFASGIAPIGAVAFAVIGLILAVVGGWPLLTTGRFWGEMAIALLAILLAPTIIGTIAIIWAGMKFFEINVALAVLKFILNVGGIIVVAMIGYGLTYGTTYVAGFVIGKQRLRKWSY